MRAHQARRVQLDGLIAPVCGHHHDNQKQFTGPKSADPAALADLAFLCLSHPPLSNPRFVCSGPCLYSPKTWLPKISCSAPTCAPFPPFAPATAAAAALFLPPCAALLSLAPTPWVLMLPPPDPAPLPLLCAMRAARPPAAFLRGRWWWGSCCE